MLDTRKTVIMKMSTTTQPATERIVILSESVLLTFTGILVKSSDPAVVQAARQLYAEVKKARKP